MRWQGRRQIGAGAAERDGGHGDELAFAWTKAFHAMSDILLIDDDPVLIVEQIRQTFPAPEHRIVIADTGAAGIDQVRASAPDVILLDLHLPDQSGLEVYGKLRAIDARIPVIFITAA